MLRASSMGSGMIFVQLYLFSAQTISMLLARSPFCRRKLSSLTAVRSTSVWMLHHPPSWLRSMVRSLFLHRRCDRLKLHPRPRTGGHRTIATQNITAFRSMTSSSRCALTARCADFVCTAGRNGTKATNVLPTYNSMLCRKCGSCVKMHFLKKIRQTRLNQLLHLLISYLCYSRLLQFHLLCTPKPCSFRASFRVSLS